MLQSPAQLKQSRRKDQPVDRSSERQLETCGLGDRAEWLHLPGLGALDTELIPQDGLHLQSPAEAQVGILLTTSARSGAGGRLLPSPGLGPHVPHDVAGKFSPTSMSISTFPRSASYCDQFDMHTPGHSKSRSTDAGSDSASILEESTSSMLILTQLCPMCTAGKEQPACSHDRSGRRQHLPLSALGSVLQ